MSKSEKIGELGKMEVSAINEKLRTIQRLIDGILDQDYLSQFLTVEMHDALSHTLGEVVPHDRLVELLDVSILNDTLSDNESQVLKIKEDASAVESRQDTDVIDLNNYLTGTANQVTVTDDGDNTVTLSTPQDIHAGASPTFAGFTKIGGASNYLTADSNGKVLFLGTAGLAYGEISTEGNSTETTISVAGTKVQVTIFDTNGPSNNSTPDNTEDHIAIINAGHYLVLVSATINSSAGAASKFEITVQKNNGSAIIIPHVDRNLGGGGSEAGVISMSGIADLAVNDTVEVWIENETNTQNYVVEDIALSIIQIGGT